MQQPPAVKLRWQVIAAVAMLAAYAVLFHLSEIKSLTDKLGHSFRRWEVYGLLAELPFIFGAWLGDPGQAGLFDRLPILLAAAGIIVVALAAGRIVLELLRVADRFTRLEQFALSAAIGLQVNSLVMLAVGTLWSTQSRWFWASYAVMVLVAAMVVLRRNIQVADQSAPPEDSILSPRWLWLAAPVAVLLLLGAMLPPVDFDVREYHLQGPKEFFQIDRITFLPHNVYANMPLGAEQQASIGMAVTGDWWTGALVGKTVMAAYTLFAAVLVYAAGRRWYGRDAGIIATVLYLTTPWIFKVSVGGLNEGASSLYWLAAVHVVLCLHTEQQRRWQLGLLAGLLAGAAAACKYPAALFVVIPLFVWIAAQARSWRWQPLAAYTAGVVVCFGPWLLKNALLTGNPVYPLLDSIFDGATRTPELAAQWNAAHRPPGFGLVELFDSAKQFLLTNDWAGLWLIPLAIFSLLRRDAADTRLRRDAAATWPIGYFLLFVLAAWWLATHRIDRFLAPALPLLALLAGRGGARLHAELTRRHGRLKWAVPLMLSFGLLYCGLLAATGAMGTYQKFFVQLELLRKDPVRVDAVHLWANDSANQVTGLLLVGDAQPFDLEVPAYYNTVFDPSLLLAMQPLTATDAFHQQLAARRISHLYVHWGEIDRYRSPGNYGFPDEITPELFDTLVRRGVLQAVDGADAAGRRRLYQVLPPPR